MTDICNQCLQPISVDGRCACPLHQPAVGAIVPAAYRDSLAWIVEFCEEHPEWFGEGNPCDGAEYEWLDSARALLGSPEYRTCPTTPARQCDCPANRRACAE